MDKIKLKQRIKLSLAISILIIILAIVIFRIVSYGVQGEDEMPFELSKITVVSTAEGISNEDKEERWNLNINQNNDIYISLEKNEKFSDAKIKNIVIEDINISNNSNIGNICTYMPNSTGERIITNSEETKFEESLTYRGASQTDYKNLEIGNQGGTILFRVSNNNVAQYISNDDEEIRHDGTLIGKTDVKYEDLKFNVQFNLIISMKDKSYKGTINLEMPCGDIVTQGTCNIEKTDFSDVIFKRI